MKAKENHSLRLEWRTAAELADNPSNWRTHPDSQVAALKDVINEVGWAGALLYNERTQHLIDGHARKDLDPKKKVPVLVGSWSEEDEKKILATLDPLADMAEVNTEKLDALLQEVKTDSGAIAKLLQVLGNKVTALTDPIGEPGNPDVSLDSENLVEIRCRDSFLSEFQGVFVEWGNRDDCEVNIS